MRRLLIFIPAVLLSLTLRGQTKTVTGTVTSADDNSPLPGVNVVVKGTSKGTVTDVNGAYSIELTPDETALNFTFVGYVAQEIPVTDQSTIDVVLQPETQTLDEVVVIGYGVVRKSDLTGAVSSIRGSDLTTVPAVSPMQSLQGKVAGVQITSLSGAPGSTPVVRIRGTGTFNNSSPIYVVDGVILDNIDFLSSADIESMEVLKDASSTAIYGSRGANGVIMVTTKHGVAGTESVSINASGEYGIQQLQKKIDLLSGREFATVVNEITPGSYNNVDAVPNTDWQDLLFDSAPMQNYNVSATGSSAKLQYYFGLGYFRQQGIIAKSDYERFSFKFNNTYNITGFLRLGSNISFTPNSQQNTNSNAPFTAYRAQPTIEPFLPNGFYSPVPGVGNFLADIEYTNNYDKAIRSVNNIFAEVDLFTDFTLRSSFGVDMAYRKNKSYTPRFFVSPQQQASKDLLSKRHAEQVTWLWENTITYNKKFGIHQINAVAGFTMQEASSEFIELQGQNLLRSGPDFWYFTRDNLNPTLVNIPNGVENDINYALISYLFRANYTLLDRYLLTLTYRRDGSSKFSSENRYGDFPSVAVGWNIINEPFLADNDIFTNLKLRASWGIIGNEKIQYDKQYSRVLNGVGSVFGLNETLYPGASYGVTGNENLKWESTYQTDVGIELGFLNDQLTIEADYYHKTTKDILIDLPVPGYLGNGVDAKITYNAAEVLNRGFEYNIGWTSESENGFRYAVNTVGTTIHNEAIKVMGSDDAGDYQPNAAGTTRTAPGLPIGSFFGYVTDGIFQNAQELAAYPHLSNAGVGDFRFRDVDGNGVLNSDDRTYIGSPIPTFLYGLNVQVGYKAFDIALDFQGQSGNDIYNAKETVRPDLYNFEQHVINRWTGEGTSNVEPRSSAGGYNWQPSTHFVQDGSFIRLRNVTIGFNLPASVAQRAKMKSARLYLRGTNVFTLADFTGYSPEVTSSTVIDNGIDNGTYPVSSVYAVGLNVTF